MKQTLLVNSALDPEDRGFVYRLEKIMKADVIHFSELDGKIHEKYRRVAISGCPVRDRDAVKLELHYYSWVKDYGRPVLGICAGHQILGKIFGGRIRHNEGKEMGYYMVRVCRKDQIFDKVPDNFVAYKLHTDSVVLPKSFELLASSKACRVQVMRHRQKQIYGIQFHPEKTQYTFPMLKNFMRMG